MDTDSSLALLFLSVAGVVAGVINTMAGGGSFLSIPALMLLGLDPATANASNRLAVLVQSAVASFVFYREGKLELRRGFIWSIIMTIGAAAGAYTATALDEEKFVVWFGILFVGMSMISVRKSNLQTAATQTTQNYMRNLLFPALVGIGFYGGFIQAGVGILILLFLGLAMNSELVEANGFKNFMVLFYTFPVLFIFAIKGLIDYRSGACLAAGNVLGGYIGARLSMRIHPQALTYFVSLVAFVTGLTLIFRTF